MVNDCSTDTCARKIPVYAFGCRKVKHYKLPICAVVALPGEKAELTCLFSPSSSALGKHPMVFNPMTECVALPQLTCKT